MARRRLRIATLALAVACQACAQTQLPRPSEPVDTEVGHAVRRIPGNGTIGRVEQHGTRVTVRTTRTCDLQKVRTVDRATWVDVADPSTTPVLLVVSGAAVGLLGVVALGLAAFGNDSQRVRGLAGGAAVTAVGAALLTGGVLMARDRPRPVRLLRIELEDGLLQENVPCRDVPNAAPRTPITGRAPGPPAIELPFGDTDAAGALEIDLTAALPPSLLRDAGAGATMRIFARERDVGAVRLDEAAIADEAQAWARAEADACATATTQDACDGLAQYLRERPAGAHAHEAREALERGKAGLPARLAAAAKGRAEASREHARGTADLARQQAATAAARRGGAEACRRICETSCKRDAGCTGNCVARSCQ